MIKGFWADIIVTIYLVATLYARFQAEEGLKDHPILSILAGLVLLLVLWALIKAKILEPDYFGLLGKAGEKK